VGGGAPRADGGGMTAGQTNRYTTDQLLSALVAALPYPEQISDIDTTSQPGEAVRFTWRHDRFRIGCYSGHVERSENGMLIGDNTSILMTHLVERALLEAAIKDMRAAQGTPAR
jgi:hypothetical protein